MQVMYNINMWTCPLCNQQFVKNQQVHSCGDNLLADFLKGKSVHTIALFRHFTTCYQEIGKVTIHPTKSMIAFAAKTRIAYVTRLGKDFVDIVFPFKQSYDDNLCFHKIAKVPGQLQFNHHFRMYRSEDVNDEVLHFMRLAYDLSL
jgi:Domain of unknown function (DUF5655)